MIDNMAKKIATTPKQPQEDTSVQKQYNEMQQELQRLYAALGSVHYQLKVFNSQHSQLQEQEVSLSEQITNLHTKWSQTVAAENQPQGGE